MTRLLRILLAIAYLAWLAAWFWAFSFGFSSAYFDHHRATRIPVLLLGLFAVAIPPLSCYWTLSRALAGRLTPLRAVLLNGIASAFPLGLFWSVLAIWRGVAHGMGRNAFEADEAMGNGIVFLFCAAVFLAAVLAVPLVLGCIGICRRRR